MRMFLIPLALLVLVGCADREPQPPVSPPAVVGIPEPAPMDEREAAFAAAYRGVGLRGAAYDAATRSLQHDGPADAPPAYRIERLLKAPDGRWVLYAGISLHGYPIVLPIPLQLDWAGAAAVLSIEDLAIPGMGTFSARFILDGDRYAGTWSGAGKGGTFFGIIEPTQEDNP